MNLLISLNKPRGITSNDALQKTKKLFKTRKAGHAGTLDPIAEGVLLIGLNETTKIFPYLSDLDKEYVFTARLGITTDTYDEEGTILTQKAVKGITEHTIRDLIPQFTGTSRQRAPIYSALKHQGRPLYEYARSGIALEPPTRVVEIHHLELTVLDLPFATFRVSCSTGTYIRSLCSDMGAALGLGAHITMLKRTRIGPFRIEDSVSLEELPNSKKGILSIDRALGHIPALPIPTGLILHLKQGRTIRPSQVIPYDAVEMFRDRTNGSLIVRLVNEAGNTFAIGQVSKDSIKVKRLLNV